MRFGDLRAKTRFRATTGRRVAIWEIAYPKRCDFAFAFGRPLRPTCFEFPEEKRYTKFLYRAGAETPLNFRDNFRVSPRTILKNFSAAGTQTTVLVSTAEVWISAPDTQTPIFLIFWVYTADFVFFLPGDNNFRLFS